MAKISSKYNRSAKPTRSYNKLYLIATEGETEKDYLELIQKMVSAQIKISVPKPDHKPNPDKVIERMEKARKAEDLRKGDEAWLIIDKDTWPEEQIQRAFEWAEQRSDRGCALSNPCFEYWILLHFEKPKSGLSTKSITDQINKHIPNYEKRLKEAAFSKTQIEDAIKRAEQQERNRSTLYPEQNGTMVYKLIESIFKHSDKCCC